MAGEGVSAWGLRKRAFRSAYARQSSLPYIGVGIGFGDTKVDYGSVWPRSPNPEDIRTGHDQANAEEVVHNMAGVASSGQVTVKKPILAFQAVAGMEYFVFEHVAFDLRVRLLVSEDSVEL